MTTRHLLTVEDVDAARSLVAAEIAALQAQKADFNQKLSEADSDVAADLLVEAIEALDRKIHTLTMRRDGLTRTRRIRERDAIQARLKVEAARLQKLIAEGDTLVIEQREAEEHLKDVAFSVRLHFELVRDADLLVKQLERDLGTYDPDPTDDAKQTA